MTREIKLELLYREGGGIKHEIHVGDHVMYKTGTGEKRGLVTVVRHDNYLEVLFGAADEIHIPHEHLHVVHTAPWWSD